MKLAASVRPLPDELLDGLLGRTAAVNGCADIDQLLGGFRSQVESAGSATLSELVASALEGTVDDIESRFTTIPARHPFTEASRPQDGKWPRMRRTRILERTCVGARACEACIQDDQNLKRRSHWRRLHHIPTVDWCPIHGIPLFSFGARAFLRTPTDALRREERSALRRQDEWFRYPALVRYSEVLEHWLGQGQPLSVIALDITIREGLSRHGVRWESSDEFVGTLVRQQLPSQWIEQHWPDIASMRPGAAMREVTAPVGRHQAAPAGPTCALVLAAIFDTAAEVLAHLAAAHAQFEREASEVEALWRSGWEGFDQVHYGMRRAQA